MYFPTIAEGEFVRTIFPVEIVFWKRGAFGLRAGQCDYLGGARTMWIARPVLK
jgi:hypothetical protein